MKYNHLKIESKWQDIWENEKTFKSEIDPDKEKCYILDMFPYPSGSGLHVGHPLGYTATDIYSRFKRLNNFNVLHPIGWDAFGLPAEQYAIKTGTHPKITTEENIKNFKRQIKMLGFSYDWDREINTTDEKYYKWTQWIFLQLYKKVLAYEAKVPVNWCPELKAVLANEEVVDGKSEIGGHPVIRKPMRQWMFKITEYAESLLEGLDDLDWPESVKELQKNWIGKSIGAKVTFKLPSIKNEIEVFTTRPDTLFGATYVVLAPEHPFASNRFLQASNNLDSLLPIMKSGDIDAFIKIVELEALSLHAMMMTSTPYFILIKPNTLEIIQRIWDFRMSQKIPICFTLDAGANVHLLYPLEYKRHVLSFIDTDLKSFCENEQYLIDQVGQGARKL